MRSFDYLEEYKKLLTPQTVSYIVRIHEYNGRYLQLMKNNEPVLYDLEETAKVQSTESSNRIEGVVTTDDRLKKLVLEKTMPKTKSEQEIAGYRDVLSTVHKSYQYIPIRTGYIIQLHRDLYRFSGAAIGGSFKDSDNKIVEQLENGEKRVRFIPVTAWETPQAVDSICEAFVEAKKDIDADALVLIPIFILDFLCVHPFNDGSGRMSRLLTLLLLYQSGYMIGKYISLEKLIADTKDTYYEALEASSANWHEGTNDYAPFVNCLLGIIIAAYRDFASRVDILTDKQLSKIDRVREIIKGTLGEITKSEIMEQCPDISQTTVQRALGELLGSGEIIKIGGGRYTSYVWNRENE